ncbi:peroxisomal membrane protein PEX14 isoform X2 [Procambarus clarkii]|uniref:peroxisomal membrane protein PEX14 isoform X2 n=1 Tax=Procambarus clarkii TaxID=6728 RepID=UPI001E671197|nr:peroxisomal membrane protein PEX14-like isoform X2 [Procambarus clarkii]
MSGDTVEEPLALRHNLVDEAAKFLLNPNVMNHAYDQKTAFLHKKGLTEAEIQAAFSKAKTVAPAGAAGSSVVPHPGLYPWPPGPAYTAPAPPSVWIKIRDVCNLVFLLMGTSYGAYHIYKKYLGPWLTGRRQKTVEESMIELQQSVVTVLKEVQTTLTSLEQTLVTQNLRIQEESRGNVTPKQLDQLKGEIASLKGLLINRRTFPSTPGMAPSIPSWQRSKAVEKPVETSPSTSVSLSNQVEVMDERDTSTESQEDPSETTIDAAYVEKGAQKREHMAHVPEANGHDKSELCGGDSGSFPDSSDEMSQ